MNELKLISSPEPSFRVPEELIVFPLAHQGLCAGPGPAHGRAHCGAAAAGLLPGGSSEHEAQERGALPSGQGLI